MLITALKFKIWKLKSNVTCKKFTSLSKIQLKWSKSGNFTG